MTDYSKNLTTAQSNIVKHVPSRARGIDQILEYAKDHFVTNEMLIKVGLRMNRNLLFGSNQRCVAMLIVFKSIMHDISQSKLQQQQQQQHHLSSQSSIQSTDSISPETNINCERPLDELQNRIKKALDFLDFCRPLSVSMKNASKLVKDEILNISQSHTDEAIARLHLSDEAHDNEDSNNKPDENDRRMSTSNDLPFNKFSDEWSAYEDQRRQLVEFIDRFIDEEIWSAQRGICENILTNIATQDVILVYGCSTIVQHVLLHAKVRGKVFKVIVVDSPPHFNGRRMMSFLNDNMIDVSYTLINSLSFVMRQATKVLLGANSMLANGYVMSHIGTSQVALMAKASNVPTLVCCETYKLSDRVYVDSFGCNEVDSGHELDSALNLRYDLTPPEFVSIVINERNTVPPNSVPALLRFRAERTRGERSNPVRAVS